MHFMNQDHQVMTENFTECLIGHRGIGSAPEAVSEFSLNHAEGGFHIAALVLVLQEFFPPVIEVVKHLLVVRAAVARCIHAERHKGSSASIDHFGSIFVIAISRVRADFANLEIFCCGLNHRGKVGTIARISLSHFHGSNDVRFYSGGRMDADPFVPLPWLPIFVVEPANEAGSSEASGIYGKISLYRLQGQAAFSNQLAENRSECRIFQSV